MCYFLLEHAVSFWQRSWSEIGFFPAILFNTTNKRAWYTMRLVPDEVFVDEDSDYDPDVEDRTSNSIEHVSEVGQDVNTDTSDETVFSGLPQKTKKPFCHCSFFNKC